MKNIDLPSHIKQAFISQALELLNDLQSQSLQVVLIPAPIKMHSGHMIRSVDNRNPKWYRDLYANFGVSRRCTLRSLKRLSEWKISSRSYYDKMYFEIIKKRLIEGYDDDCYQCYFEPNKEVVEYFEKIKENEN